MRKYCTVAKINFKRSTWVAYMVAGICALAMAVDFILDKFINNAGDKSVSIYSMLYIICLMAPIFIASGNYSKLMNLGVKRKTYLGGCIINYVVLAGVISLLGVLEMYLLDRPLNAGGSKIYGLIEVFGWDENFLTAFFSQFAFLLLVESIIHTLTFMQTKWYGWLADVVIIVIISVFTPIPALRVAEVFFFDMVIFAMPIVQIAVCLVLSALIYATNLYYIRKRSLNS